MTYLQALNRQKLERAGNVVVLIERLPDCYRYTTRDGRRFLVTPAFGIERHPIVLCGREGV